MKCLEFLDKKGIGYNNLNRSFINHVEDSSYSIILNSAESDMCRSYALYILYWVSKEENRNKTVYVYCHHLEKVYAIKRELSELSKRIYMPTEVDCERYIKYKNGCKVRIFKLHKHVKMDEPVHFAICVDFAEAQNNVFMKFYKAFITSAASERNNKLIVSSHPNGLNLFYKLFRDAEAGINNLKPLRLYFWEDGKKDSEWVMERIKKYGEDVFNQKYNLIFSKMIRKVIKENPKKRGRKPYKNVGEDKNE